MSTAASRWSVSAQVAWPIALGLFAFFLIVGPRALDPTNIVWLGNGDLATHYLGWLFFSQSAWTFPLGMNPNYGLELSNAILFSDSNPLLAFLFKPFVTVLPQPFQYFGIWLLACFVLQAWFAWKLAGLVTPHTLLRVLGTGLFVFAPPMIFRVAGHPNLAGHFLIVAALYFVFHPALKQRMLAWSVLLCVAGLVHAYLLAMAGALWFANLVEQRIKRKLSNRVAMIEFIIVCAIVGVACWQAGYFVVGSGASGGSYGLYRMNLLSIADPSYASYVLKDIPEAVGDYEGFNFLGLGVILLSISVLPTLIAGKTALTTAIRRFPVLLIVLVGLTLFALSNKVGIGSAGFEYPLPDRIIAAASFFRGSGRIFWPVFYVIVFTIIFLVIRGNSYRTAGSLMAIALVVQVADMHAGWQHIRKPLMVAPKSEWPTPMVSAFWKEAAQKYKKVRWVMPAGYSEKWMPIAAFAGAHGLATDAVYLARLDTHAFDRMRNAAADAIKAGKYESDALYFFDDAAFRLAALNANSTADLLFRVDGFNVLAPGWKACATCRFRESAAVFQDLVSTPKLGEEMPTGPGGAGLRYLVEGWSVPHDASTWSDGASAEIVIPMNAKARRVRFDVGAYVSQTHPKQRLVVSLNGVETLAVSIEDAAIRRIEIPISEIALQETSRSGLLRVRLSFPDAVRPVDIGIAGDNRRLAFAIHAITLE
jgi:Family of unknown function (DUF6311)